MALDLRAELDEARAKQEAAEQAAAAAAQRATVAEAKLEAAGMGPMPKMGPTAEQLVINSTQRIRWGGGAHRQSSGVRCLYLHTLCRHPVHVVRSTAITVCSS